MRLILATGHLADAHRRGARSGRLVRGPPLPAQRIYKRAGYCFKTSDMIRAFGNAGCQYDDERDVPFPARNRAEVASISRLERTMGCR